MSEDSESIADIEAVERKLLLEGIFQLYGYDFREYAEGSLARRIQRAMDNEKVTSISMLQERILHSPKAMQRFVGTLSIHVTSMFRDPEFFRAFREHAVPILRTYPFLRIWIAGCSTGEEVYSLAILLKEEDLLDRCRIYATDISDDVVQTAKSGIYSLSSMQEYTKNYQLSGGKSDFSGYYSAQYDKAVISKSIVDNISFAQHNLCTDQSFNEFHVILCRNVMIYFNRQLQERVMHLFDSSLSLLGFLCLGTKESLQPPEFRDRFREMAPRTRLFRAIKE